MGSYSNPTTFLPMGHTEPQPGFATTLISSYWVPHNVKPTVIHPAVSSVSYINTQSLCHLCL